MLSICGYTYFIIYMKRKRSKKSIHLCLTFLINQIRIKDKKDYIRVCMNANLLNVRAALYNTGLGCQNGSRQNMRSAS